MTDFTHLPGGFADVSGQELESSNLKWIMDTNSIDCRVRSPWVHTLTLPLASWMTSVRLANQSSPENKDSNGNYL